MPISNIIPLILIKFSSNNYFFYSTIGVFIKEGLDFAGFESFATSGFAFSPRLLGEPSAKVKFDSDNPRTSFYSVDIEIANIDRLQHYDAIVPLESATVIFAKYDLTKKRVVFSISGYMGDIKILKDKFSFTLIDKGSLLYVINPTRKIDEKTFQTTHTFGPFDINPLSMYGLLVDIGPGVDGEITTYKAPGFSNMNAWPPTSDIMGDDTVRSIITWVEHPSLYVAGDDNYWVGALLCVLQDPASTASRVVNQIVRTDYRLNVDGINWDLILDSPYTGWPYRKVAEFSSDPNDGINACVVSKPCIGATAYIVRSASGKNAKYDVANKKGRIYLDIYGPELTVPSDPDDPLRLLPYEDDDTLVTLMRQKYSNRTDGAKVMCNLTERHVLMIKRRALPEGMEDSVVGKMIPIAYGCVKKGMAIHAIGGKATGDKGGAGNDWHIFCGHPMAFRVNLVEGYSCKLHGVQFAEAKIWHSLDKIQQTPGVVMGQLPVYFENENELSYYSLNPFPRISGKIFNYIDHQWESAVASRENDPLIMWFNSGEDVNTRYQEDTTNRQTVLWDNYSNAQYSGIRLRGDEYWAELATAYDTLPWPYNTCAIENPYSPRYSIRNGLGSSNIYVDFNGHPDFDDGFLTGVPASSQRVIKTVDGNGDATDFKDVANSGGLVSHPVDIIAHYQMFYSGNQASKTNAFDPMPITANRDIIDWPSYRKAKGQLFNWEFAVFMDEAVGENKTPIDEWAAQCRLWPYFKNGKFFLKYIDLSTRRPIKYLFNSSIIERGTFSIDRPDFRENLYSKFVVKYNYYAPKDKYATTLEANPDNNRLCAIARDTYNNNKEFTFECPNVFDSYTAGQILDFLVSYYTIPRNRITFTSPVVDNEINNIEITDQVVVIHPLLPSLLALQNPTIEVVGDKQSYMITGIDDSNKGSIKFSAVQLFDVNEML